MVMKLKRTKILFLKIVLKVCIYCQKCKRDLLRVVTKFTGIDEIAVDIEKGTLTVVGTVDPACLTKKIRKSGKMAEIVSVGPPKPPEKEPHKPEAKPLPACCNNCQIAVGAAFISNENIFCSIL
ncbi:hypothetical protein PVL29_017826 [Vitis rotundifolia]|uniref:HMA domain-containing protein n=1 Tax=Vitis rotundifolia TaxID=103349 RepID=A0AA38Z3A3_VITRO|nr:hypothetical protein PVL29_017826 [Vitis rotundifolia]